MRSFMNVVLVLAGCQAWSASVQIVDPRLAAKASYLSNEMEEVIPWWIFDGQLVGTSEARDHIRTQDAVVCATWLMNWSEDKSVDKETIQAALLSPGTKIPHWKTVNGRPIFLDRSTDFALSFICASKDKQGRWVEVESTDFAKRFKGIYAFEVDEKLELKPAGLH
jgi:hypothetical protein